MPSPATSSSGAEVSTSLIDASTSAWLMTGTGGQAGTTDLLEPPPAATETTTGEPPAVVEDAIPSAGCDRSDSAPMEPIERFDETVVLLPPGYDGASPYPVIFALHSTGHLGLPRDIERHPIRDDYVIVLPVASRHPVSLEAWDTSELDALIEDTKRTLCVDEGRLFAAGNASGARYLGAYLQCNVDPAERAPSPIPFRAVALVGNIHGCTQWPALPTFYTHGIEDPVSGPSWDDPDGTGSLADLQRSNGCGAPTPGGPSSLCPGNSREPLGTCNDFEACEQPLRFCQHWDPTILGDYSLWPCFALDMIQAFFAEHGDGPR